MTCLLFFFSILYLWRLICIQGALSLPCRVFFSSPVRRTLLWCMCVFQLTSVLRENSLLFFLVLFSSFLFSLMVWCVISVFRCEWLLVIAFSSCIPMRYLIYLTSMSLTFSAFCNFYATVTQNLLGCSVTWPLKPVASVFSNRIAISLSIAKSPIKVNKTVFATTKTVPSRWSVLAKLLINKS